MLLHLVQVPVIDIVTSLFFSVAGVLHDAPDFGGCQQNLVYCWKHLLEQMVLEVICKSEVSVIADRDQLILFKEAFDVFPLTKVIQLAKLLFVVLKMVCPLLIGELVVCLRVSLHLHIRSVKGVGLKIFLVTGIQA